jgi:hypothetical protein
MVLGLKRKLALSAIGLAAILGALGIPAAPAAAWHRFHGGAVIYWGPEEVALWRGGYWHYGLYDGRIGWWWAVGGGYYWYPEPIYPYPTIASEVVVTEMPIAAAAPVSAAPAVPMYYYCDNPAGYYPNVPVCNQPFRPVPVTPQH